MKKLILAALAVSAAMAGPALADPPPWAPAYGHRDHVDQRQDGRYDNRGRQRYSERRLTSNDRVWRQNGQYRCHRSDGTTGTIVGAGLGALAGNAIAGRGDRTLGTILGGVGGGLLGRSVDRGDLRCR